MLGALIQNLSYSIRALVKKPGFTVTAVVGRVMQSTLYGVDAMDVRAFGAVALVLLVAALVACLVPAWRASRVEPIVALRYE